MGQNTGLCFGEAKIGEEGMRCKYLGEKVEKFMLKG